MNLSLSREKLYADLISASSNTALIELRNMSIPNGNRIFMKLEYANPVGSIHMRVYPFVFKQAEKLGFTIPGITPVIEASFGNAGAAFTHCANVLGYNNPHRPKVVVPGNISKARLNQLQQLGAELIFSPEELHNLGYVQLLEAELQNAKAKRSKHMKMDPGRLYPITKTRKNAKLAYKNLVEEVRNEMEKQNSPPIDYFVGIVGSGTSISGIGETLKEMNPKIGVIAAEPSTFRNTSNLMKEGQPLPLDAVPKAFPPLAAIGVPLEKLNLNREVIDGVIQFDVDAINEITKIVQATNNINIGKSTAGALLAALTLAEHTTNSSMFVCAYDEAHKWDKTKP